jgi:hypothetical protein
MSNFPHMCSRFEHSARSSSQKRKDENEEEWRLVSAFEVFWQKILLEPLDMAQ